MITLTDQDKREIAAELAEIIKPYMAGCKCGLSDEKAAEMGHLVGRLVDIGAGNLNAGIEEFSQAVQWVIKFKRRGERIGGAVAVFLAISIASGAVGVLWLGFKAMLSVGPGGK